MFSRFRRTFFVALLPLFAIGLVYGDSVRMQWLSASARAELTRMRATTQDDGLGRTLQAHYVRLNEQGRLAGTISAIDQMGATTGVGDLEVALVQNGVLISETMTLSDGTFETDPVLPGAYTLCVSGDEGFLAYGIMVIAREGRGEPLPLPVPGGAADDGAANDGAASEIPSSSWQTVAFVTGNAVLRQDEPVRLTAAVIPPEFTALQRIMSDFVPPGVQLSLGGGGGESRINVEKSVVAGGFQVSLDDEGSLLGRVAPLSAAGDEPIRLREMNAFLLVDDEIYARVNIQEDGNFVFHDVEPGVYGFAAAGPEGFAAISFQALAQGEGEDTSADNGSSGPFRNAGFARTAAASDKLEIAICPKEDLEWLRDKIDELNQTEPVSDEEDDEILPPIAFPPGGGFGFAGGGGGGGWDSGFNFGQWIEAGIAAWLISEAFDRDRDTRQTPISPTIIRPIIVQ